MVKITLVGFDEAINGLKTMAKNTPKNIETELDNAGKEVKEKMAREAPLKTGALRNSIKVIRPERFVREIEPFATNVKPGSKYAGAVETGTGPVAGKSQYIPNVESIKAYFGVDKRVAWAIALSIMRKGTKPNPFISRTLDWTEGQLDNWGGRITARLENDFARG